MAVKKTYLYEVLIGHNGNAIEKEMVYARNSKRAIELCKEKYKDYKYDWYKTVKRGQSKTLCEDKFFTDKETESIRKAQPESKAYAERKPDAPWEHGEFIPVEALME